MIDSHNSDKYFWSIRISLIHFWILLKSQSLNCQSWILKVNIRPDSSITSSTLGQKRILNVDAVKHTNMNVGFSSFLLELQLRGISLSVSVSVSTLRH